MADIQAYQQLLQLTKEKKATLVAVSKFKSEAEIQAVYDLGQKDFGENYVQELVNKYAELPKDIQWHFIGHLQTNKVKYIAPFVHLIQSVDSFKLLKEINKQAEKSNRIISVLLQCYLGDEDTKYGFDEKETIELLSYYDAQKDALKNIKIKGLMGMATNTDDEYIIKSEFMKLKDLFEILKIQYFLGDDNYDTLSMGMSSDFNLALENGSTMLRIGSTIFGKRI